MNIKPHVDKNNGKVRYGIDDATWTDGIY